VRDLFADALDVVLEDGVVVDRVMVDGRVILGISVESTVVYGIAIHDMLVHGMSIESTAVEGHAIELTAHLQTIAFEFGKCAGKRCRVPCALPAKGALLDGFQVFGLTVCNPVWTAFQVCAEEVTDAIGELEGLHVEGELGKDL
jgi:hypothetical protein